VGGNASIGGGGRVPERKRGAGFAFGEGYQKKGEEKSSKGEKYSTNRERGRGRKYFAS